MSYKQKEEDLLYQEFEEQLFSDVFDTQLKNLLHEIFLQ